MKIIDDEGNLFGAINIIDALVVALVLAVVVSGVVFVSGGNGDTSNPGSSESDAAQEVDPVGVKMEVVGVEPYIADALTVGPVETEGIVAIENKSVNPTTVVVEDDAGNLYEREHPRKQTVTLQVILESTMTDGEAMFHDKPLEIGQRFTLDFGDVTVKMTVTEFADTK